MVGDGGDDKRRGRGEQKAAGKLGRLSALTFIGLFGLGTLLYTVGSKSNFGGDGISAEGVGARISASHYPHSLLRS